MPQIVPLQYGQIYHIYNRGNNREDIFREARNYRYFMQLFAQHICPIAVIYAYCLLRNHFHFLLRIKDYPEGLTGFPADASSDNLVRSRGPSQSFSNFFNAYTKAFNRTYHRTGALFQRPFGRIPVTSGRYVCLLVTYIHQNPARHGFVDDFREWPYSSYHALLSSQPSRLERDDVLGWFGGAEALRQAHQIKTSERNIAPLALDDFD
jgi:REP element-mobilizing transposase RayT